MTRGHVQFTIGHAMFSFFRRGFTAKIMLVILGIGLFAIVATGFGTGGTGGISGIGSLGTSTVASVDGEGVPTSEVTNQVNRQFSRARQQYPELDIATFVKAGAVDKIVNDLITTTALRVFARKHGIAASAEMINRDIANIPAFHNIAGQFDNTKFRQALAQERITEAQVRGETEDALIQRQMLLPVGLWARAPQGIALPYASLLLEIRSGSLGPVPAAAMGQGTEPSDSDIAAYYRTSQARYMIPERRVIRYAIFGPEQVAGAAQPSAAEITNFYNRNKAGYGPKETRTLSQIVLPSEAAARAFNAKLAAGTSFAKAASDAGFGTADIALGQQTREAFAKKANPQVAEAAFAAAQGAATKPIKSEFGWHIVRVDGINNIPGRPMEDVRAEITTQLSLQKMQEALSALEARIQDSISDGSSLEEIAAREKLTVRETAPITGAGAAPGNPGVKTPAEVRPLLKTAFDMTEDEEPVVEPIQPNVRFGLFQIARIIPAAAPPLPQIRERVKADLVAKRANDRARAVATSIIAKINAGMPFRQAFGEAEMALPPVLTIAGRRMDLGRDNKPVPPPLQMLFSMPRGKAKLLAAGNGNGWFVVYLDKIVSGDATKTPGLVQATHNQFNEVFDNEYTLQFVHAVQAGMKIKRNQKAIDQLKAQLTGGRSQ